MGKPQWFKFYPADFLLDNRVSRMSLAEVGLYWVCLCHAWIHGGIPGDEKALARLLRVPPKELRRHWPGVSGCFHESEPDSSVLVNPRLEREREVCTNYLEAMRLAGEAGARKRWATPSPADGKAIAEPWPGYTKQTKTQTENQKEKQTCPFCGNTGWRPAGGGVEKCACRRRNGTE